MVPKKLVSWNHSYKNCALELHLNSVSIFIFSVSFVLPPVEGKPTYDFMSKSYIPQNGQFIAKCVENPFPIGIPSRFTKRPMRVKNASNVIYVLIQVSVKGIWNRICWYIPTKNHSNVMLATKVLDRNNCWKGIKIYTIIQIIYHLNQR